MIILAEGVAAALGVSLLGFLVLAWRAPVLNDDVV
jgi:hypothetical protein